MPVCAILMPIRMAKRPSRGPSDSFYNDPVGWGGKSETLNKLTKLVDVWRSNSSDAGSNPAISTRERSHFGSVFLVRPAWEMTIN